MALSRRTRMAMIARSFALQGSWNYRTLVANGFAFAILPALREIFRGRPAEFRAAVARHTTVFNSHPYLAGIALGAVARLEAEGAPPVLIDKFKAAVRGSLGGLGDRLVWAGLRPVCVLLALGLLFAGTPWWITVLVFLFLYNAGHIALRLWSFRLGLEHGKAVGERLRQSRLPELQRGIASTGAFLLGFLIPLAAVGGLVATPVSPLLAGAALLAAAVGLRFGSGTRKPAVLTLTGVTLLGLLYEVIA